MGFSRFRGNIVSDQRWLTEEFIQLYRETPSRNDMMLAKNRVDTVIFDGSHWREFDLKKLQRAAIEHGFFPSGREAKQSGAHEKN